MARECTKCFPFYTYREDCSNRRENITGWALEQFRARYHDPSISKWDIFHYIYAVLHHPEYRERYAANLRRELPRIPFVGDPSLTPANTRSLDSARDDRVKERPPNGESVALAKSRSFDSVNGLASESIHSAQDDRVKKMGRTADRSQLSQRARKMGHSLC